MADTELLIKASYGSKASTLAAAVNNGTFRVTDTGELFTDINDTRVSIGSTVYDKTEEQIKALAVANILPKIYVSTDTNKLFWYSTETSEWVVVGGDSVDHAATADRATGDEDGNSIKSTYETKADATTKNNKLGEDIASLRASVEKINSFEIKIANTVSAMPVPGASNVMYFVPNDTITGNSNVYDEYIWISEATEQEPNAGHYENIGTTEAALGNYYTKAEVDAKIATSGSDIATERSDREAADTALGGRIDALTTTVGENKTALENADTALGGRIDGINTVLNGDGTEQNPGLIAKEAADVTALGGRIDALTTTVGNNKTAADQTQADLDTLEADVATINRFKKAIVDQLPDIADADEYTMYFVPEKGLDGATNKYGEYIKVDAHDITEVDPETEQEVTTTIPVHFERIDSTVDFTNYYTKAEVDAIKTALQGNIGTNATAIETLTSTVNQNRTALEAVDTGLDNRLKAVEDAIGSEGGASIASRVGTLETALNGDGTEQNPGLIAKEAADVTALGGRIDSVNTVLNGDGTEQNPGVIANVAANKTAIEAVDDKADQIRTDFEAADTALDGRLDTVEDALNNASTGLAARVTTAESDIDALETAINGDGTEGSGLVAKQAADAAAITALTTTVTNNKTASDNADTALSGRLDTVETALNGDGTEQNPGIIAKEAADIATVNAAIQAQKTAYEAADTALGGRIDTLVQSIGNINRFDIRVLDSNEGLPEKGEVYIIYFVPNTGDDNNGKTKYVEYMWVADVDPETHEDNGYYEEIGITEADLDEYYTSAQVDNLLSPLTASTTKHETALYGDGTTANPGLIAKEAADVTTLQGSIDGVSNRVTTVETALGSYPTEAGTKTITERLASLETSASDTTVANRVTNLETALNGDGTEQNPGLIAKQASDVATLEAADTALGGRIDGINTVLNGDGTAQNPGLIAKEAADVTALNTRVTATETALNGDGTEQNPGIIAKEAADVVTLQGNIDAVEDKIDAHSFNYAGSDSEGGAANTVKQSVSNTSADQHVLLASTNNTGVEYSDNIKVNAANGSMILNAIKLGDATITFDAATESLVFNF